MIGTGAHGRQQHHHQVHRLIVHGVEVDRLVEAGEGRRHALEPLDLAMRNGNAIAQAGRAQLLPARQGREDFLLGECGQLCSFLCKDFK